MGDWNLHRNYTLKQYYDFLKGRERICLTLGTSPYLYIHRDLCTVGLSCFSQPKLSQDISAHYLLTGATFLSRVTCVDREEINIEMNRVSVCGTFSKLGKEASVLLSWYEWIMCIYTTHSLLFSVVLFILRQTYYSAGGKLLLICQLNKAEISLSIVCMYSLTCKELDSSPLLVSLCLLLVTSSHPEPRDTADSAGSSHSLSVSLLADSVYHPAKSSSFEHYHFYFEVTKLQWIKCLICILSTTFSPPHSLYVRTLSPISLLSTGKWNATIFFIPSLITDVNQFIHVEYS